MTRSRKHPLGLTLLSENYKQLLSEYQDFSGRGLHRTSSSGDSDGENSGLCTPAEPIIEQPQVGHVNSSGVTPARGDKAASSAAAAAKSPRPEQPCHTDGVAVVSAAAPAAAAAASPSLGKGSKRPVSSKPARTPSIKQTPVRAQHKPVHGKDGKQQWSMLPPRQQAAEPVAAPDPSAAVQKAPQQPSTTPEPVQRRLQKQASKQPAQVSAQVSAQAVDAAVPTVAHAGTSSSNAQGLRLSRDVTIKPAGHQSEKAAHAAVEQPQAVQQHTSSVQPAPADRQPKRANKAQPAATTATPAAAAAAPHAAQSESKQAQAPQLQHQKRSRRRVGDSSQPLTSSSAAAALVGSTAATATKPQQDADSTATAAVARSVLELPRLPLQRLQAGTPVLLPPLHPTTARTTPHSAGSTKTSKSEPASARMSRRTSECNSTDGACADSSSRKSDSTAAAGAGTVRQHSLPESTALPSNRRHSIACLVEVSRKQQQQRTKAGSEGGLLPGCADSGSMLQRSQLQPLQPLKQLQEIRRRTQLRAGGEDSSSHDCQILILEGPPAAGGSSKQGLSSSSASQHTGQRQPGSAAVITAGSSTGPWPGATDPPAATGAGAGAVHRRTRSSNTQLPPLDEHTVLAEPGLPGITQAAAASGAQVLTLPAAGPGSEMAQVLGLQSMGSDGVPGGGGGGGYLSRRSSRADSEASSGGDSTAGGLVCEPSSFGVCADPAGAVHLVTPAIPDKLARLKQRLPSRLTADNVASAVAAAAGTTGDAAAAAAALQGGTQQAEGSLPLAAQPAAAAKPERARSRRQWQLPAVNPPPQQQQLQQQPQLPAAVPAPAAASQPQQHWQHRQQQPHGQHSQHELPVPSRSNSCRQGREAGPGGGDRAAEPGPHPGSNSSAAWGAHGQHVQPQSWDGGTSAQHQYAEAAAAAVAVAAQQQQQQGMNHSFMSELKRQLEHWASWVHLHSHNPQQVPPPPALPPQLQATIAQQEQYQHMAQQQLAVQAALQQQQYYMQHPGAQQAAGPVASAGAIGGFAGPVPAHGALSRFTDPWAEKQQQRLMQHRQSTQAQAAAAGADHSAAQHAQQGAGWQQQQQEQVTPPPVVSASAMMQQRRAMQQQAFEGLSLEAVLASAKKTKPPSRRQLMEGASGQGEVAD